MEGAQDAKSSKPEKVSPGVRLALTQMESASKTNIREMKVMIE